LKFQRKPAKSLKPPEKPAFWQVFSFWRSVVFVSATGRRFPLRPRLNITGQCEQLLQAFKNDGVVVGDH
jgi:hypothetical protein